MCRRYLGTSILLQVILDFSPAVLRRVPVVLLRAQKALKRLNASPATWCRTNRDFTVSRSACPVCWSVSPGPTESPAVSPGSSRTGSASPGAMCPACTGPSTAGSARMTRTARTFRSGPRRSRSWSRSKAPCCGQLSLLSSPAGGLLTICRALQAQPLLGLLPHPVLEDLPRRVHGEGFHKVHVPGHLVLGHV